MYDNSLNVGLDVEVHEVNVGVVLLTVCHERDEGLGDSMCHPPTQTVHMGLMKANRFQEWCLRPEEFIHNVLEWRNSEILTNTDIGTGIDEVITRMQSFKFHAFQVGENLFHVKSYSCVCVCVCVCVCMCVYICHISEHANAQ